MSHRGHVLLLGVDERLGDLAVTLLGAGYAVTSTLDSTPPVGRYDLVLVEVRGDRQIGVARMTDRPWIAWCTGDESGQALAAAYEAGALAALPPAANAETVLAAVGRAAALARRDHDGAPRVARYAVGDPIELAEDAVLGIVEGVVAQYALHEEGDEVLLGLWGPDECLLGHPDDACALELRAHVAVTVWFQPWRRARTDPTVIDALSRHLRRTEAWSSMQARQNMEQRLAGILSLLAEQFGVDHPDGKRLTVRVTHQQLASSIGANRGTVTRLIGRLRRRGDLRSVETDHGERLVWCRPEHCHHGTASVAVGALMR